MTDMGNLRAVWLEAFVAVADCGKRTAAGAAIGLDQATVTKHVQKLEVWCRTPLIETDTVPAVLTDAGRQFLDVARPVVDALRTARPAVPSGPSPPPTKTSGRDVVV